MEPINGKDRSNRRNETLEGPIQRSSVPLVRISEKRMQGSLNPEGAEFLLDNSKLFYQKLREFHESYGLSLVASVASTVLDLFMLYRKVTIRGGFAMVTKYERWAEVVSVLNFTSRVPDPSFQLQDLYANLLYRFELIYFSGDIGLQDSPSGLAMPCSLTGNVSNVHSSATRECSKVNDMQKNPCQSSGEKLNGPNGVMNHVEDSAGGKASDVPCLKNDGGLKACDADPVAVQVQAVSGEKDPTFQPSLKKEASEKPTVGSKSAGSSKPTKGSSTKAIKKKDPDAPLSIRTGYHFFLCKECERLKKIHGRSLGPKLREMVIDSWKNLSDSDRQPYIEESRKDKVRFDREMVAYNERQSMQNVHKAQGNKHKPESSGIEIIAHDTHEKKQIGNGQCTIGKPGAVGIEMVTHGGHRNIKNGKGQCTIANPGSGVEVVPRRGHQNMQRGHQSMQIGNKKRKVPNPESNGVEKVAHEEHANKHIGNEQLKVLKPELGGVERFAYEDYQNMLIGGPRYKINSEPSADERVPRIDIEQYETHNSEQRGLEMTLQEDHQNMHIGKIQCKNNGPEPCELVMEAHSPTEVGEAQCEIHNPESDRDDPVGPQEMQIVGADYIMHNSDPSDPGYSCSPQTKETSNAHLDGNYHVQLRMEQMDEINKLRKPDQSLVQFAVELMENAERLDASLQIQLGDFLSVL